MNRTATRSHGGPGYAAHPGYRIDFVAVPRRVRVQFAGVTVGDSDQAMAMHEGGHPAVYYLPRKHVAMDHLHRTAHRTHCPFKGDASYWTLRADTRESENAVWSYENPYDEVASMKDYMAFYGDRVDAIDVE